MARKKKKTNRTKTTIRMKPDMSKADLPLPPRAYDYGTPELWDRCRMIKERVDEHTVRARNLDSSWPVDRYHTRGYINDYQHGAAQRIYHDFTIGGAGPRYSGAWPDPSRLPHNKGLYRDYDMSSSQAQHLSNFREAYASLNYEAGLIVWYVVCVGVDIGLYEQAGDCTGAWRKGYGMTRLREALDDLVRFYKGRKRQNAS